jgi:hypothetical protein
LIIDIIDDAIITPLMLTLLLLSLLTLIDIIAATLLMPPR